MQFNKIPKQFAIELVKEVTKMVNSLPRKGGVHAIQSPRMLVAGIRLHTPTTKCGQYVQGHVGGPNNIHVERTIDSLYIGRNNNGSGHWVFKLNTKEQVSVNRVTAIQMTKDFIERINEMWTSISQPAGIQIPDEDENLRIHNFLTPESDANSHASDESYKYPDDKLENNVPLNIEGINEGGPDSELQQDHFQGRDDVSDEEDSNNNDDDHVSLGSNKSISIQSANTTDNSASSNNNGDIDILDTKDDDAYSTTSKNLDQIPKELHKTLDCNYWLQVGLLIDDTRPDLAVNLDRFYWNDNNHIGHDASIVLSAITQYSPIEPSYVLATMLTRQD